jgi:hypothetical protein
MEQVAKLVDWKVNRGLITTDDIIEVNIQMLKQFAALHPETCVRLAIDATDITAWVQQIPEQDTEEKERRVRRRARGASYRVHIRDGVVVKRFRGYWLFALVDIATNRPVTWCLWPGAEEGARHRKKRSVLCSTICTRSGETTAH